MKCQPKKVLSVLLAAMLFMCCFVPFAAYAENDESSQSSQTEKSRDADATGGEMNLDVVFVLDASGSMIYSDPDKIALDAFNLFTDLLDETCGVGYDVYTHKIEDYNNITKLKKTESIEEMKKKISSIRYDPHGFTDIALGLTKAMDLFDSQSSTKKNKNKAIILLSDGNTNLLEGSRTVAESKEEMEKTLASLKEKKIPVYTIGLNHDKTLDRTELENISDATGGKTYEAGNSDMLTGIAGSIFSDIANVKGTELKLQDGNVTINVKDNTVFYVGVVIRTKLTETELNPVLKDPDGKVVDISSDKNIRFTSTYSYKLLKLVYPKAGKWQLHLSKAKNGNCSITQLDYYSVYVKFVLPEYWGINEKLNLEAALYNGKNIVDDYDLLKTMNMVVYAKNADNENQEEIKVELERQPDGKYKGEFKTSDAGNYVFRAVAESENFSKESDEVNVNISGLSQGDSREGSNYGEGSESDYENQTDFFSALKTIIIVAVVVVVIVVVVIIILNVSKNKKKNLTQPTIQNIPTPSPAPRPQPRPVPPPVEKAPELVQIPVYEHASLEELIKKGEDSSVNKSASDYQSDKSLEGLIHKGQEDPFKMKAEDYKTDESLEGLIKTGGEGFDQSQVQSVAEDPSLAGIVKTGGEGFDQSQMQPVAEDPSLAGLIKTGGEGFDQSQVQSVAEDPSLAGLIKTGGEGLSGGKIDPLPEEEMNDDEDGEDGSY